MTEVKFKWKAQRLGTMQSVKGVSSEELTHEQAVGLVVDALIKARHPGEWFISLSGETVTGGIIAFWRSPLSIRPPTINKCEHCKADITNILCTRCLKPICVACLLYCCC